MYRLLRKWLVKINDNIGRNTGFKFKRVTYSRPSTLKAKEIFGYKKIRVLEIGCAAGNNALDVLNNLNVSEYFVVDPYDKYNDGYNDYSLSRLARMREEAVKRLNKYSNKITWIYDYSENAINNLTGRFDYIYIDGNHSYEFVKKDMNQYFELLNDEFVFGGHDIDLPDVARAFVEFVSDKNQLVYEVKDPDWIVYYRSSKLNKPPSS